MKPDLTLFNRNSDPVEVTYAFARSWGMPHEPALDFARTLHRKTGQDSRAERAPGSSSSSSSSSGDA